MGFQILALHKSVIAILIPSWRSDVGETNNWADQYGMEFTQFPASGLFSFTNLTLFTSIDTMFLKSQVPVFWSSTLCWDVCETLDCTRRLTFRHVNFMWGQSCEVSTFPRLWLDIGGKFVWNSQPIYYYSQRAIDYTCIQERHLLTLIRQNLVDVQACNYLQIECECDLNAPFQCSLSIKCKSAFVCWLID